MRKKGLDPAKLARLSNINPTGIYDILSGKSRSPKIETIAKIAAGLNVPVAVIFSDSSEVELRSDMEFLLSQLPEQQQTLLLQTARAWVFGSTSEAQSQ